MREQKRVLSLHRTACMLRKNSAPTTTRPFDQLVLGIAHFLSHHAYQAPRHIEHFTFMAFCLAYEVIMDVVGKNSRASNAAEVVNP